MQHAQHTTSSGEKTNRFLLAAFVVTLILAVYPFTNDPTGDVKYLVSALAALFLVAGAGATMGRNGSHPPYLGSCAPILALWFAVSVVATAQAHNVGLSIVTCGRFAALVLIYFATVQFVREPSQAERIIRAACIATVAASIYGIGQHYGWDPLPWDTAQQRLEEYRRAPATFGNPNLAGHVLVLVLVLLAYLGFNPSTRWVLALAPIPILHHALTGHRAGYVALAAGVCVALIATAVSRGSNASKRSSRAVLRTIGLAAMLAILATVCLVGVLLTKNNSVLPTDLSALLRINSLWSASRMAVANPLLGTGAGNYQIENARFWSPFEQDWYATERKLNTHVHSDVLETAVETGILGAACHIGLFVLLIAKCLSAYFSSSSMPRRRLALALAAFFLVFAVDGLAGFNLRAPVSAGLLFVMAGICDGVFSERTHFLRPRFVMMRRPVMALLVVGALVVSAVEACAFASQSLLLAGRGALYWNDFPAADRVLARAHRFAPWNWEVLYDRGLALQHRGDRTNAVASFELALLHNPNYLPARIALSSLAMQALSDAQSRGESDARYLDYVQTNIDATLVLCPNLPEANEIAGRIAVYRAGNDAPKNAATHYGEAVQRLRHAVAYTIDPLPETYALLARALLQTGALDDAETVLARAAGTAPDRAEPWQSFEQFARTTGRTDALLYALECRVDSLRSLQAQQKDVRVQLADAYVRLGNAYTFRHDNESANHFYRAAARLANAQPNKRTGAGP